MPTSVTYKCVSRTEDPHKYGLPTIELSVDGKTLCLIVTGDDLRDEAPLGGLEAGKSYRFTVEEVR